VWQRVQALEKELKSIHLKARRVTANAHQHAKQILQNIDTETHEKVCCNFQVHLDFANKTSADAKRSCRVQAIGIRSTMTMFSCPWSTCLAGWARACRNGRGRRKKSSL
jgi:hypothetical protein